VGHGGGVAGGEGLGVGVGVGVGVGKTYCAFAATVEKEMNKITRNAVTAPCIIDTSKRER
jgi:hypothetical protein